MALPSVTEKDRRFIEWAVNNDVDFIAHSFVRSARDIQAVQEILDAHGSPIKIISKIENQEGVDNIDEIIDASYGIMIARGDLGVELPAEAIPNTQRRIVEKCICAKRPVIIATQMLYSMVKSPRPTRAEVSDVASAIYERVDAVMLSDETAMGDYPVAGRRDDGPHGARAIERDETHFQPMIDMDMVSVNHEITAQLARSAVRASTNLPVKFVVLDTKTGRTGRYLAAFRGRKTVMAVCYQLHAQRILALSYGVVPILRNQKLSDKYHFLIDALEFLDQYRKLNDDDLLAIVGGSFGPDGGASYIEIANVRSIRQRNAEIEAQNHNRRRWRSSSKTRLPAGRGVEHGREDRLDAPDDRRAPADPQSARSADLRNLRHPLGRRGCGDGRRRQRLFAEPDPAQKDPTGSDYKAVFVFNMAVSTLLYLLLAGTGTLCGPLLRDARHRAHRSGLPAAAARLVALLGAECHLHAAVPLRAAFEGQFPLVVRQRSDCRGARHRSGAVSGALWPSGCWPWACGPRCCGGCSDWRPRRGASPRLPCVKWPPSA